MKRNSTTRADVRRRILVASIHDVMPQTLPRVRELFDLLTEIGISPVTLLVVPGRAWDQPSIDALRQLNEQGAIFAGHGWKHRVNQIRGFRHRLHSALISRDVAEHLALDEAGIVELIERCYEWFAEHELPVSDLYVPPAWALGQISRGTLAETPFRLYETLTGIVDAEDGRYQAAPMIGFEADTAFRAAVCIAWNRVNLFAAGTSHPLRLGIHPNDLSLKLSGRLRRLILCGGRSVSYDVFKRMS